MKLSVNAFLTLDGVMQAPGGRDEDRSGGFDLGGWLVPHADEDMGRIVDGWFRKADTVLLGRNTYTTMWAYWSEVDEPDNLVTTVLNTYPKYVVSTSLTDEEASWSNTTVLRGDFLDRIRELKQRPGGELQVHGSWQLAHTLHNAGLVDTYRLLVFPVVLGRGKRLFGPDAARSSFRTVSCELTGAGATSLVLEPVAFSTGDFVVKDGKVVVKDGKVSVA